MVALAVVVDPIELLAEPQETESLRAQLPVVQLRDQFQVVDGGLQADLL